MDNTYTPLIAGPTAARPAPHHAVDSTSSEATLLQAARGGDAEALELLLASHERSLYLLCLSILGSREDAEDAVQEAFLRAVQGLRSFRGEAGVRAWLTRIAVNVCLEQKRRRRSRVETRALEADRDPHLPSPEAEVLDRMSVLQALAALPTRARAILLLKEREGWSAREIAQATRCTERQVYYELRKAYQALADWRRSHSEE